MWESFLSTLLVGVSPDSKSYGFVYMVLLIIAWNNEEV